MYNFLLKTFRICTVFTNCCYDTVKIHIITVNSINNLFAGVKKTLTRALAIIIVSLKNYVYSLFFIRIGGKTIQRRYVPFMRTKHLAYKRY